MRELVHVLLANAAAAGLLALGAWVASRRVRRQSLVHGLWLVALVKLVTPPLVPLPVVPEWTIPELRLRPAGPAVVILEADSTVPVATRPTLRTFATTSAGRSGTRPVGARPIEVGSFERERSVAQVVAGAAAPTSTAAGPLFPAPARGPEVPTEWPPVDPAAVLASAVLAGALAVAALTAWRVRRFGRLLRLAMPASSALVARVDHLARRVGLPVGPPVDLLPARVPPMLWPGRAGPRLLMPAGLLLQLSDEERDALLLHELAHVRRRDHLVRLLELAVSVLFWWYPVAWWARRALRQAEERCCDEWVLRLMPGSAHAYAEGLLKSLAFVTGEADPLPVGASGAVPVRDLETRLKEIMMTRPTPLPSSPARLAFAAAAVVGLAVFPTQARPTTDETSSSAARSETAAAERAPEVPPEDRASAPPAPATPIVAPEPAAPAVAPAPPTTADAPVPPAVSVAPTSLTPEIAPVPPMAPVPLAPAVAPEPLTSTTTPMPPALALPHLSPLAPAPGAPPLPATPSADPLPPEPPAPAVAPAMETLPAPRPVGVPAPRPVAMPAPRPVAMPAPRPAPGPRLPTAVPAEPGEPAAPAPPPGARQQPRDEAETRALEEKGRRLAEEKLRLYRREIELTRRSIEEDLRREREHLKAEAARLRADGRPEEAARLDARLELLETRQQLRRRELDLKAARLTMATEGQRERRASIERLQALEREGRHDEAARVQAELARVEEHLQNHALDLDRKQVALEREAIRAEQRAQAALTRAERLHAETEAGVDVELQARLERQQGQQEREMERRQRQLDLQEAEQAVRAREREARELEREGRPEEAERLRAEADARRQDLDRSQAALQARHLLGASQRVEEQLAAQLDGLRRAMEAGSGPAREIRPEIEREIARLEAALAALRDAEP